MDEFAFYGFIVSLICLVNLTFYCKTRSNVKSKKKSEKIYYSLSLESFEELHIETGEKKSENVYSNGNCPHCGEFINLNSHNPRYFAFDCNICSKCYWKLMKAHGKK